MNHLLDGGQVDAFIADKNRLLKLINIRLSKNVQSLPITIEFIVTAPSPARRAGMADWRDESTWRATCDAPRSLYQALISPFAYIAIVDGGYAAPQMRCFGTQIAIAPCTVSRHNSSYAPFA
jgi:hypothetical protein